MKIAFSNFVMGNGKTGIATYIKELLTHLQRIDTVNTYEIYLSKKDVPLLNLVQDNRFKYRETSTFLSNPIMNILWHNTVLPYLAKKRKYDLIHIPSMRRIPLIKGCKVIATIHDLAPLRLEGKYDVFRMAYHRHFLTRAIHGCDRIITVSHSTKKDIIDLTNYPENKIEVIYPGINHEIFKPIPKDLCASLIIQKPFFVYVSRIEHPGKNHIRLIQAFEKYKRTHNTNHQLLFAGADWNGASHVKRAAQENPFAKDIHFLGFVTIEEIAMLYSSCELMVFPSLYEGFGFPILEAMACGAKVICSNTSSMKEIANDETLLFDPLSANSIYHKMFEFTIGNGIYSQDEKIAYAKTFDWEETAKKTINRYKLI